MRWGYRGWSVSTGTQTAGPITGTTCGPDWTGQWCQPDRSQTTSQSVRSLQQCENTIKIRILIIISKAPNICTNFHETLLSTISGNTLNKESKKQNEKFYK